MKTITELLKRLAELRPGVCKVSYPYDTCDKAYHLPCFLDHGLAGKTVSFCAEWEYEYAPRLWELQGAVQQAIEDEGWKWGLLNSGLPGTDAEYGGRVLTGSTLDADSHWYGTSDDSPAHALLAAYVAALEAVAEVAE